VPDARLSSNVPLKDTANTFTQDQRIERTVPRLKIVDSSQPANARQFQIYNDAQMLVLAALNDAETVASGGVFITRTGSVLTQADYYEKNRTTPMGHWIDVPYNAANFTASTGTWTVESGDLYVYSYCLIGKTCIVSLFVNATSVSASAALYVAIPGGYIAANYARMPCGAIDNTIAIGTAFVQVTPGANKLTLYSNATAAGFAVSTNATQIFFVFPFPIQ
jgi:hypothetical protein